MAAMANAPAKSPSPRLSPDLAHAFGPATPTHSPHHSHHTSVSFRTPLHTLSIREYRRLQNTPNPTTASPSGRTLRRKAAASALNGLERTSSLKPAAGSNCHSLPLSRPLHFSQSAYQLTARQTLPPSPPHFFESADFEDAQLRSQSAGPGHFGGTSSAFPPSPGGHSQDTFPHKVSNFKPIKRLPKPVLARPGDFPSHKPVLARLGGPPSPIAVTLPSPVSNTPQRVPLEILRESDTQQTPSSFSLSRFPQPPRPHISILTQHIEENASSRLEASFTTAPATPPATPAVIHYRGASFDLVNPHDSLLFHDIETPSRELDSTEFLPLQEAEQPLLYHEMAPKRPLYGDLSSAYNSIRKRDDAPNASTEDVLMPPEPVFASPERNYSSYDESYDSNMAVSPLDVKKEKAPEEESRFSIKQMKPIKLARSLTKKLQRTPQEAEEQELTDFSPTSPTTPRFGGEYPRPLDQSYPASPSLARASAADTFANASRMEGGNMSYMRQSEVEQSTLSHTYTSVPLSSTSEGDISSHVAHGQGHTTMLLPSANTANDMPTRPYYEEVESLYQSSSIYEGDGNENNRGYPPSLYSRRMSKLSQPLTFDDDEYASPYQQHSIYSFADPNRNNDRRSSRVSDRLSRSNMAQGHRDSYQFLRNEKTDTITRLIERYGRDVNASSTPIEGNQEQPQVARGTSGFSQFKFDLQEMEEEEEDEESDEETSMPAMRQSLARKPNITQSPGAPPRDSLPLAPPFEYDDLLAAQQRKYSSEMFSGGSYGDTRQLLRTSQPQSAELVNEDSDTALNARSGLQITLDPSSSYSQTTQGRRNSSTPLGALQQAEKIFDEARSPSRAALKQAEQIFAGAGSRPSSDIPAMWARRGSGNRLGARPLPHVQEVVDDDNNPDWETLAGRPSVDLDDDNDDSIADYSDSEEDPAGGDIQPSSSLPGLPPVQRANTLYRHPSPLPTHEHPFSSSPPPVDTQTNVRTGYRTILEPSSSAPHTSSIPRAQLQARGVVTDPYFFMPDPRPWAVQPPSPYDLTEKETREMLTSGPNDDILYGQDPNRQTIVYPTDKESMPSDMSQVTRQKSSPYSPAFNPYDGNTTMADQTMTRQNTFDKVTIVGPKGNLTGTPQGTGMHEVGSSIADNSSPGARWGSTSPVGLQQALSTDGKPPPKNKGKGRAWSPPLEFEVNRAQRPVSECTLFPSPYSEELQERTATELGLQTHGLIDAVGSERLRLSMSSKTKSDRARPAVVGQTRLREMLLASDTRTISSGHSTHFSHFQGSVSGRPSTANTQSPLRPSGYRISIHGGDEPVGLIADKDDPHIILPDRPLTEEREQECNKKSWLIFALFSLPLPPLLVLYPWIADPLIAWMSDGRIGSCAKFQKKIAVPVAVGINVTLVALIALAIILGTK